MFAQKETKTIFYDVRAVRLIKSVHGGPIGLAGKAGFISLGHFDFLHVDHLLAPPCKAGMFREEEALRIQRREIGPLAIIQNDRRSGREIELMDGMDGIGRMNQVYTLYILRQLKECALSSVEQFWKRETTYMVVTRIHCQYPEDRQKKRLTQTLIDYCCSLQPNSYRVSFDSRDGEEIVMRGAVNGGKNDAFEPVYCLFYDSLELGDCVSVMKGRSVAAILEVVQCLSREPTVRDTYTYCGIQCSLLHSGTASRLEDAVHPLAELPHMTTRFSIRKASAANQYLCDLTAGADSAYVTGTADRILCWHDTSERNLLQIVQAMVQREKLAHNCFNDIITRIGIKPIDELSPLKCLEDEESPGSLTDGGKEPLCGEGLKKLLNQRYQEPEAPSWAYSLLKLIGTLESMQDNYIMDDLAALITPGAKALLARMEYLLKNPPTGRQGHAFDRDVLRFLHDWSDLMHDLSQLESQLTQHPELMPVRYYIPVTLLQFELRFMGQCGDLLQENPGKGRQFVPMLVPSGERDLYTIAPLDPCQDSYSGKCPLIVYIPIQDLYDPWNCSMRMAHEIAHYVGDTARMRGNRFNVLGECLSYFIGRQWEHYFLKDAPQKDEERQEQAIKDLNERVMQYMRSSLRGKEPYMDLTVKALTETASNVASDSRNQSCYLITADSEYFDRYAGEYANQKYAQFQQIFQPVLFRACGKHIKALRHMSSECYADIVMILLLNCDFDQYYSCIYLEEFHRLERVLKQNVTEPPFDSWVVLHMQRMSLVIMAINLLRIQQNEDLWVSFKTLENDRRIWANWAGGMARVAIAKELQTIDVRNDPTADYHIKNFLLKWQINSPTVLTVAEMRVMAEYLAGCAKKLYEYLHQEGEDTNQIKETLSCLGGSYPSNQASFLWDELQQYILRPSPIDE